MQRTVETNLDAVCPSPSDRMRRLFEQLGPAPSFTSDELSRARAGEIVLELKVKNANLASEYHVRSAVSPDTSVPDGQSQEEALWVSTKRYVLALLKVQPGENLLSALTAPVTPEHELLWNKVRYEEAGMQARSAKSSPNLAQLEDFSQ